MKETKRRLYVEKDGFWTEASMLLMGLAMVFLLIGSIGRWEDLHYLITMVALPVCSGLLFLLCLLLFGKRAFWTTVIPVVAGVVYFVFRIMDMENELIKVGFIAFYVVIVVLYAMVFSHGKLKWLLAAVLLGIFAYRIGVKDLPVLMDRENPVSFLAGMDEMSVLGILLSLLFLSFAMKTPKKEPTPAPEIPEPEPVPAEEPVPEEPAPEPESVPAEEPVPEEAPPEEKKLGWLERRRLEKEKKEQKPAALLEMQAAAQAEETAPAEEPIPAEEPAAAPETPEPEPIPAEEPASLEEQGIPESVWAQAEGPAPESVPIQELEIRPEPTPAYPLVEPVPPEDQTPPADAGADTP